MLKKFLTIFIIILLVLLADQLVKKLIFFYFMNDPEPIYILPFFHLDLIWNHGISFSLFSNYDYRAIIAVSVLALLIITFLFNCCFNLNKIYIVVSFSFLIGGAMGNIFDRIQYGAVIDYFSFEFFKYRLPVFNLADIFIGISALILIYDIIKDKKNLNKPNKGL